MRLKDKVAIVTGAARGIGFACAERFAQEGAKVVLADLDQAEGEAAAERLQAAGGEALFVTCDAGDKASIENLVASAVAAYGRVDVSLANAGIVHACDFLDFPEEDFDRVLRVNLKGVFLLGQAAGRQMVAQGGGGCIINMSSINAVVAIPSITPYVAAKGGVNQLTKVMSLALAEHNIRVNAIGPGSIMTDMVKSVNANPEAMHNLLSRTPAGRIGEASEIAGVAMFLATDDSSYVTGQIIYADGGRLGLNYTVPVKS